MTPSSIRLLKGVKTQFYVGFSGSKVKVDFEFRDGSQTGTIINNFSYDNQGGADYAIFSFDPGTKDIFCNIFPSQWDDFQKQWIGIIPIYNNSIAKDTECFAFGYKDPSGAHAVGPTLTKVVVLSYPAP